MAHVHFDNTEDETHAALIHDCQPGQCPRRGRAPHARPRARRRRDARAPGHPRPSAMTDTGSSTRSSRGRTGTRAGRARAERPRPPQRTQVKRVKVNGCWYFTRDTEAGIRAYTGPRGAKRFWHGYYGGKAMPLHRRGHPHRGERQPARADIFATTSTSSAGLLGQGAADRHRRPGLSIESRLPQVHQQRHRARLPLARQRPPPQRHDQETHDRHGIPRCKHCGGPTGFVRFSPGDLSRRLRSASRGCGLTAWLGATSECAKTQTRSCSENYRLLVPLWRTERLYYELRESHRTYEAAHD